MSENERGNGNESGNERNGTPPLGKRRKTRTGEFDTVW